MLFHSYNMFAGGKILINGIECEWDFFIPLEEWDHVRQKTKFQHTFDVYLVLRRVYPQRKNNCWESETSQQLF